MSVSHLTSAASHYVGFFELDGEDRLVQTRSNEYVAPRSLRPSSRRLLVHTKREHIVSRL